MKRFRKLLHQVELNNLKGEAFPEPLMAATRRDWDHLLDNPAWDDIIEMFAHRLLALRDDLESLGEGSGGDVVLATLAYTQGICYGIRTVLNFPEARLSELEAELKEEQSGEATDAR